MNSRRALGINSATIGTSYAYIADVTPQPDRARAVGLVGMAFGLGFIVGPAIGVRIPTEVGHPFRFEAGH